MALREAREAKDIKAGRALKEQPRRGFKEIKVTRVGRVTKAMSAQ